jgi:hypothetical protein
MIFAVERQRWECHIESLEGQTNKDGQRIAAAGQDGWELVAVVAFSQSNFKAFFKRAADRLSEFEQKNAPSAIKTNGAPKQVYLNQKPQRLT